MKKVILSAFVLAMLASPVLAQDTPKAELFGGYSYFRYGGNATLGGGWHGSIAGNVNNWFGLVGEFSGHYGENRTGTNLRLHTFTFGPRFSFRRHDKVTPFVHCHIRTCAPEWELRQLRRCHGGRGRGYQSE